MGSKKERRTNDTGVDPRRLTAGRKKSKSPPRPDPKREHVSCIHCHSVFFGETEAEAKERRARHHCPKEPR